MVQIRSLFDKGSLRDVPWELNLAQLPEVVNIGVGSLPMGESSYTTMDFCSLHLYQQPAVMIHRQQTLAIREGSLSFTPAGGEVHYHQPGRKSDHLYVHLSLPGMFTASAGVVHPSPEESHRISTELHEAMGLFPSNPLRTRVRAWDILLRYNFRSLVGTADRVIRHIEEELHRPLSVASLAKTFGLSPDHLSRLIKKHSGKNLNAYIRHRRIDRASSLIRSTNLPIKAIAYQAGIPDLQSFNKVFRKELGASPTAYRERHKKHVKTSP